MFRTRYNDTKKTELKLSKANEELTSFAYRTSHDLRSPLVSIEGLLALAERFINMDRNTDALKAITKSSQSVEKLQTIISDILALSKSDNLDETSVAIDMQQLVKESLDQLCHHDHFNLTTININLEHTGDVYGVETRIKQMVSNLISNSLKYCHPENRAPILNISTKSLGRMLRITVEDNGIGVPKENQQQLFGMFKRFHSHFSYGSGLGLYLVKKNAEEIGGIVRFEEPDLGSRFIIEIPQYMDSSPHEH